ncbi:MAG: glycosyl hydrolase [Anaerophaga sp.]|nr:glycosyl hydrolase [Anaerophaga sp.]
MKTRNIFLGLTAGVFLLTSCGMGGQKKSEEKSESETTKSATVEEAPLNTLTEEEKAEGWRLLFNGKNFDGWRGYNKETVPGAWSIEDNAIKINGSGEGEAGAEDGGDIIYDEKFKNFELKFDWKVSKGGNSGVFYLAREFDDLPIYRSAPEYQILDNENHLDAQLGKDGNRQSASLYDLIPAKPQNSKPWGEWNTGSIIVYKGTVVHKQNGEVVLEYHLWTPEWEKMIENSKFKGWTEMINAGGEERMGYIGLQDHGDDVWFRNIKLKVME